MVLTIAQLKRIAADGGALVLDASLFTYRQLAEIAAATAGGSGSLTLRRVSGFTADQLRKLAITAPGAIVIDLTG